MHHERGVERESRIGCRAGQYKFFECCCIDVGWGTHDLRMNSYRCRRPSVPRHLRFSDVRHPRLAGNAQPGRVGRIQIHVAPFVGGTACVLHPGRVYGQGGGQVEGFMGLQEHACVCDTERGWLLEVCSGDLLVGRNGSECARQCLRRVCGESWGSLT